MKLSDFDYHLPKDRIAQYPLRERDAARMLVIDRATGQITHGSFRDFLKYCRKEDIVVINDTRVRRCRLFGKRVTGGKVEVLLLHHKGKACFESLVKPARIKTGETIIFNGATARGVLTGRNEITFNLKDEKEVYRLGCMPLPPYIKRKPDADDDELYQTVYAQEEGAIAAPTAGLHFTRAMLDTMSGSGVHIAGLTLHVGAGTFKPVKSEDITQHSMDPEYMRIPDQTQRLIKNAQEAQSRIIAVGTTSLRALEAYARGTSEGDTNLFIYPGFKFKVADALLTNFHLPKTTLFMLVCAFAGEKPAKKAYQEAIAQQYRFYSYGDAMLIL
ncbi:MAG: tRNA preQ1(34) S-adenosylmethionine ribosyltransferase-isomerase QueA [Candidatus Omnitrophica bacterium]|nr:tRNA preQ1(34) S-adenosylmethionine ribosyltransferase-isomerase QueA [Candidatus Omnitrophota bacterium]